MLIDIRTCLARLGPVCLGGSTVTFYSCMHVLVRSALPTLLRGWLVHIVALDILYQKQIEMVVT